jgi:hypothetical protein
MFALSSVAGAYFLTQCEDLLFIGSLGWAAFVAIASRYVQETLVSIQTAITAHFALRSRDFLAAFDRILVSDTRFTQRNKRRFGVGSSQPS